MVTVWARVYWHLVDVWLTYILLILLSVASSWFCLGIAVKPFEPSCIPTYLQSHNANNHIIYVLLQEYSLCAVPTTLKNAAASYEYILICTMDVRVVIYRPGNNQGSTEILVLAQSYLILAGATLKN